MGRGKFGRIRSRLPVYGLAHADRDVALLLLDPAAPECSTPITLSDHALAIGDAIVSCGFAAWHQSLNLIPARVTAYEGAATQFVAKPPIAKGMSGGPVLYHSRVAGLVCARDTDKGDHYLISLESFRDQRRISLSLHDERYRVCLAFEADGKLHGPLLRLVVHEHLMHLGRKDANILAHLRQRIHDIFGNTRRFGAGGQVSGSARRATCGSCL